MAAASECEPAVRSTAEFDGGLRLRQQLNEIAVQILYVGKGNTGRMLTAFDESPTGRLDFCDRGVEV